MNGSADHDGGVPAFLNCSQEFLLNDYLTLMPKELVAGEILEAEFLLDLYLRSVKWVCEVLAEAPVLAS
jgi:c-di-GMP-related signal transduction protein